jgi:cysteinyl-tRNA synthetase
MAQFGDTYDVHGGASELIFPHHEAEIAQAEALTGKIPFVRYWIHTGLLNVDGRKMSKSLGNMIRIRDALREYSAAELKFYFASVHYREPMIFSKNGLTNAVRELHQLRKNFNSFLDAQPSTDSRETKASANFTRCESAFKRNMSNDFYTPGALDVLQEFAYELAKVSPRLSQQTKDRLETTFRSMATVLGILS